MSSCSEIPPYTPVATFDNSITTYVNPGTAQSGIFIACAPEGFQVVFKSIYGLYMVLFNAQCFSFNAYCKNHI